jgi:SpoVK/Ycf46/Vps4 family AAA+-type ATPase
VISKKERQIVFYYLNNIVNAPISKKKEADLLNWVEDNSVELFGINLVSAWHNRGRAKYHPRCKYKDYEKYDYGNTDKKLACSIKTVRAILAHYNIVDVTVLGYERYIDVAFEVFKIPPRFQAVLRYMVYSEIVPMMFFFDNAIFRGHDYKNVRQFRTYSAVTGTTLFNVEKALCSQSELFVNYIIEKNEDGDVALSKIFRWIIHSKPATEARIKKLIFGKPVVASLTRDNFNYIADDYDHVRTLLGNAVKKRTPGVNILVYGTPGTGKTELCKSIARDIGASLYMLSEEYTENDRNRRIGDLSVSQALLTNEENSVILFDEAEDAFLRNRFATGDNHSKLYFNRMLEKNKTPVIWITNNISDMDPAYIRRFKCTLEIKKPDLAAKEGIWKNVCAKHRIKLGGDKITSLAETYDVPPSFIDTAIDAAKLVESNTAIERTIDALLKATNGCVPAKKNTGDIKFAPELLNTDMDLNALAGKLTQKGNLNFSLCLYGEPGTGKSAFARYLAEKMGLKVMQKRASDLISCWVGETEKNIATAFEDAHAAKSILVFDEADSFLRSRKMAERSWEATQVNEMLTQMESHPYPFICTTNLMRDLDEASLRRFTFKVKHDFLKPAQIKFAFKRFFGIELDAPLSHLTHLTPGDFAVVKSKQSFLDTSDRAELVRMLELEQGAKGIKAVKMGFA